MQLFKIVDTRRHAVRRSEGRNTEPAIARAPE